MDNIDIYQAQMQLESDAQIEESLSSLVKASHSFFNWHFYDIEGKLLTKAEQLPTALKDELKFIYKNNTSNSHNHFTVNYLKCFYDKAFLLPNIEKFREQNVGYGECLTIAYGFCEILYLLNEPFDYLDDLMCILVDVYDFNDDLSIVLTSTLVDLDAVKTYMKLNIEYSHLYKILNSIVLKNKDSIIQRLKSITTETGYEEILITLVNSLE